jgi:phosphoribosylamine--glycine ligase
MKILFVSGELIGSAICQKLIQEGNEVKLYIHKRQWKKCLNGIVPKIDDWHSELDWVGKDGLVVFDDVIFGKDQDTLRNLGYLVVGSSELSDTLELDRGYFQQISKEHGLNTLPAHDFVTAQEAKEFVKQNRMRWVLKQSSHISSLNHIGELDSGEDIIEALEEYKAKKISPVHIQKHVTGIEVGVARYFNGNDWVGPIEINHEHKRLCNGDTGPLTPEMGTILWYTEDENLPLYVETLKKLKPHLQKINFKGDFDINCIVNEEGIWPLEATPRFGTPSSEIQVELNNTPWHEFLSAVARGDRYDLDFSKEYGIGVSVGIAPFPYEPNIFDITRRFFRTERLTISDDITDEEFNSIQFEEISKDDKGYYWSGSQGWMFHVVAKGKDIREAQRKVYDIIDKIKVSGMIYRTDIGNRVSDHDLPKLKEWGWL